MRMKKERSKGFTLVELLVVISIIALLLSILMPSLQKAREQAKRIVCMGNIKQLAIGIVLYAEDNNGKTIGGKIGSTEMNYADESLVWQSPPDRILNHGWLCEYGYIPKSSVYYCPSMRHILHKENGEYGWQNWKVSATGGYSHVISGYQFRLPNKYGVKAGEDSGLRSFNIAKHSKISIFSDIFYYGRGGPNCHDGMYNIGFIDGHVSFYKDPDNYIAWNIVDKWRTEIYWELFDCEY